MVQTNRNSNKFTPIVATSRKALPQIYRNQSMGRTGMFEIILDKSFLFVYTKLKLLLRLKIQLSNI